MTDINQKTADGPHDPSNDEIKTATKRLIELAIKWGSDKYYSHSYIEHSYGRLFAGRKVQRVCEIGIGHRQLMEAFTPKYCHGSSLRMWSEYWPEARIFGCDIRADTLVNEGQIRSILCDQSSERDLYALIEALPMPMDIIIDDGSHMFEHQVLSARVLLPWVNKGGVYIIEDTYPDKGAELAEMFRGVLVVGNKRPDDCLVVIHR